MLLAEVKFNDEEYLGQYLLLQGFEVWFRYMFRVVEGKDFIVEAIHKDLFIEFDNIFKQVNNRENINIPPRAGKTTLARYFIVYALTHNPRCNFIYTSFSQSLLGDISRSIMAILEHPVYKAMYSAKPQIEDEIVNPIDDFWKQYLFEETGKNVYSNKKIITKEGGILLFASIGSTITGFGAGIRNAKGFTGGLFIDDANKPADIYSQVMRLKVLRYYEETLLSRLNNSNAAIVNIQQRLHLEDLSGFLIEKYNFRTLKKALLDEQGACQIPKQYSPERIKELQANSYMFSSQYQQEPIKLGGNIIQSKWFNWYKPDGMIFNRIFFTADTAQKTKEWNDYSVSCCWGLGNNNLYLIDMLRGKWEAPDLSRNIKAFWNKYKVSTPRPNSFYIEDKSSGTGLIQDLQRDTSIPVIAVQRDKDKLTRVEDVLTYIEAGRVYLPEDRPFTSDFITECESFSRDMTHSHDDITDNLVDAIVKGLSAGSVSILDVL